MVSASSEAATQPTAKPSVMTENSDRKMPKASASSAETLPRGMGRAAVRCMRASMSASYHMLSAPDAPAPTAMASSATKASTGWIVPGAAAMPVSAVKTTSAMTRGFRSAM